MSDAPRKNAPVKVGLVSLGCPKNTVDSEVMLGHLVGRGAELTSDIDQASVVVVNTCGFIEAAKEESVNAILEATRRKASGECRRVVVAGCLVHRYRADLEREIPEVDAFVTLDGIEDIARAAGLEPARRLPAADPQGDATRADPPATYLYSAATPRLLTGPAWSAYVKIAEGCDNTCAFCAIPRFRGAFRSRPLADIELEVRRLAERGVVEVNLIAQDSTAYGADIGLADGPAALVQALARIDGIRWVRLFYVYPNKVSDSLLQAMASNEGVARYIDIPLQHASRDVLARMRRGGSADSHLALLRRMRQQVPGLTVRSTFIVGFPGETEAEFAETEDFVREARLDHVGVFTYSHEESTPAYALDDDVPVEVKQERQERLLEIQEGIAGELNRARVGQEKTVLCEGACSETEHLLQGRLEGQAPEVDGRVLINEGEALPGRFYRVRISEAHPFDLVGGVIGPA